MDEARIQRVESDKEDWMFQVGLEHLGVGDTVLTGLHGHKPAALN